MNDDGLQPDWPAPARVRALSTTRLGGVSLPPYDALNLGTHVGDEPARVADNRALLQHVVSGTPCWLTQVHGTRVVDAAACTGVPEADAAFSRTPGAVCVVMTADCLPVLLCDRAGTVVGAAHAGWRGLHAGVIEATVAAMQVPPQEVLAWLGPAIGPTAFEVGEDVRSAFVTADPHAAAAFQPAAVSGKWFADLYMLARQRLVALGVAGVYGGEYCTFSDPARFYSYRRDGITGRMASLVWLAP